MRVGEYLSRASKRSFKWRDHDCCTFGADWVRLRWGADPMAAWRGRYANEEEAQAIIEAHEGLIELATTGMRSIGIEPSEDPAREGDVGIVAVIGEYGLTANSGIFTGRRWAFLAPRGLFVSSIDPAHVLRVWAL
jgi:hypothetical protein